MVMTPFVYTGLPCRVIFGVGTIARLPDEIDQLGLRRLLILSTEEQNRQAEQLAKRLGSRAVGVFAGAVMHTPIEVTEKALAMAAEWDLDGLISIGGGSTTGLSKAIALRTDLPQIVLPTTYAGSEMTPILGETRAGEKTTQRSMKVLPELVIYDVELTLTMAVKLSITSGINAIAHAVEALYAQDHNPIIDLVAQDGIAALARALPGIAANPNDLEARSDALYGAWLCGTCLGSVGMALHHKLCHVLGGTFDLPHAETHAVVLPHALAYNASAAPDAMTAIAKALGAAYAPRGLFDLASRLGARVALKDLGMPESSIDQATDLALKSPYWNPVPLERKRLRSLFVAAWAGRPPEVSN